ncbi:type II secretion system protein GspM [Kalamiella sp. sgz302252]|uniref:type II secretion system protein GspM n=1 Tax=Pantoea sp. sgz302252 TaxID=3341827 RepID=UPI0036D35143
MSADKIFQAWHSRNPREKILMATLAVILLLAGARALVIDSFQAWQLASQQRLTAAQRHYLWLQQQTSSMVVLNQTKERKAPLPQRVKRSLPEQIVIQEWQENDDGQLILLLRRAELYPLIEWLVTLETREDVLVNQFSFTQQEGAQVMLQEGYSD